MITAVQTEVSTLKASYNLAYVWLISVVAAMGGLLFGWDWVVIGGAKPFFQRYFQLTTEAANRLGEQLRAHRLFGRRAGGGRIERQIRPQTTVDCRGVDFCGDVAGQRVREQFRDFYRVAHFWRRGHRAGLQPLADVYRRNRARRRCAANWSPSINSPSSSAFCSRNTSTGFSCAICPSGATDDFIRNSWFGQQGWRWMFGLTAAAGVAVFHRDVFRARKPALAGEKWESEHGAQAF